MISRRRFLAGVGAVVATVLLPMRAWAKNRRVSASTIQAFGMMPLAAVLAGGSGYSNTYSGTY